VIRSLAGCKRLRVQRSENEFIVLAIYDDETKSGETLALTGGPYILLRGVIVSKYSSKES